MRDALNAFYINGVSSNIPFQSALMQHPRFVSGLFTTAFIADEYPQGFIAADVPYEDIALLAAVAAFARRRYIERAIKISNQMPGHQRKVGNNWVVMIEGVNYPLEISSIPGGYSMLFGERRYDIVSNWLFRDQVFRGMCNGKAICMQLERSGLEYRISHFGKQVKAVVMTAKADRLLALMPVKAAPDLSKYLLSPMPGLLREVLVSPGQQVRAGEKLAVIEAMKMENILRSEKDCKVKAVVAAVGDSLSVDQVIVEYE